MGREECIIPIKEEEMEEEFKLWKGMSIYRVPLSLKKLSEKSYQPQVDGGAQEAYSASIPG